MSAEHYKPEDLMWKCYHCDEELMLGPVQVEYLGNSMTAKLLQCPSCYMVLVSEELAVGKGAEVEKLLEDK